MLTCMYTLEAGTLTKNIGYMATYSSCDVLAVTPNIYYHSCIQVHVVVIHV